jgi:hypothetical protein
MDTASRTKQILEASLLMPNDYNNNNKGSEEQRDKTDRIGLPWEPDHFTSLHSQMQRSSLSLLVLYGDCEEVSIVLFCWLID